jgi:hypothetical protein
VVTTRPALSRIPRGAGGVGAGGAREDSARTPHSVPAADLAAQHDAMRNLTALQSTRAVLIIFVQDHAFVRYKTKEESRFKHSSINVCWFYQVGFYQLVPFSRPRPCALLELGRCSGADFCVEVIFLPDAFT